jgi:hypothetical protein
VSFDSDPRGDRDEQRRRAAKLARDGDESGRRRRTPGVPGFFRDDDHVSVADREDIIAVPVAPTRRLVSVAIAGFAGLLGLALVFGAHTVPGAYGLIILAVQLIYVAVWTVATRPKSPWIVGGVGVLTAFASVALVALPTHRTSLAPLAFVTAGAFGLAAVGQLVRRDGRSKVTEGFGTTVTLILGVVAYAMLIVLSRGELGTQAIALCVAAGTIGIVVARAMDVVLPFPRTTPQVARGTIGIMAGCIAGTVAGGFLASALRGMHPTQGVIAGLISAGAAVLADLGVGYSEASREIDGEVGSLWLVRHMQGPLGAFAFVAPVAYALSAIMLVPALN